MSYTKGEWKVSIDKDFENPYGSKETTRRLSVHSDDILIASIWAEGELRSKKTAIQNEVEANAKLISAAPDLLEALKRVENFIDNKKIETQDFYESAMVIQIKQAIKKATS